MYETLISHYNTPLYFGAEMAADANIPVENFQKIWHEKEHDRTLGKISFDQTIEMILRENGVYSPTLLEKIIQKREETKRLCFKNMSPRVTELLEELKKRELKIALISNCFSEEAKIIRQSPVFHFFDQVCLSCEMGIAKPDLSIYRECLKKLNLEPKECLYVGDGGSSELEAAREIGITSLQALWYYPLQRWHPAEIKRDFPNCHKPEEILNFLVLD